MRCVVPISNFGKLTNGGECIYGQELEFYVQVVTIASLTYLDSNGKMDAAKANVDRR